MKTTEEQIYTNKYKKYKQKYITLKNQQACNVTLVGGDPLETDANSINFILGSDAQNGYEYSCPPENPVLCTYKTDNYGLCKKADADCLESQSEGVIPISATMSSLGESYGYTTEHLHKTCVNVKEYYNKEHSDSINVPSNLRIITYNIWGLEKKVKGDEEGSLLEETMRIRLGELAKIIITNKPDIVCFQEMTKMAYKILNENGLISLYEYRYEEDFGEIFTKEEQKKRNHNVEVFILSRFKPSFVKIFSSGGNLGYDNSFMVIGFNNLLIANIYCQAGSKHSPGQESVAIHYSRCRYQQYKAIYKKLVELNSLAKKASRPMIITGDFNTNLNGLRSVRSIHSDRSDVYTQSKQSKQDKLNEWPEMRFFKENDFKDAWLTFHSKNEKDLGNTEETDINTMRWNLKFMEKHFRYDGFLLRSVKGSIEIKNIYVVGTEPIITTPALSQKILDLWIPKGHPQLIKYGSNKTIDLFPSDHFGVVLDIELATTSA